ERCGHRAGTVPRLGDAGGNAEEHRLFGGSASRDIGVNRARAADPVSSAAARRCADRGRTGDDRTRDPCHPSEPVQAEGGSKAGGRARAAGAKAGTETRAGAACAGAAALRRGRAARTTGAAEAGSGGTAAAPTAAETGRGTGAPATAS